jgi:hypothetical protein
MSTPSSVKGRAVSFSAEATVIPLSSKPQEGNRGLGAPATSVDQQKPVLKARQAPKLDLSGVVSRAGIGDSSARPMDAIGVHTAPVTNTRQASSKVPSTSYSTTKKTAGLNSTRKANITADSPRQKNITPRRVDTQSSAGSTETTPRAANQASKSGSSQSTPRDIDQEKQASPRDLRSRELRKKVSRKFNELKLNLAALPEKIVPSTPSSPSSPTSAGRVSPVKLSPTKRQSNLLKDVPVDIRNQLAKAYAALKKDSLYTSSGDTRKNMMLNAKMIGILSENQIAFDEKKLQALAADALLRSQHEVIDIEIDLTKRPYPQLVHEGSKKFMTRWESDNSDKGQTFKDLPGDQRALVDQHFMPTFIADYYRAGVSHELKMPDGASKPFPSPIELAEYLNQNTDGESRSRYISNVTSQNIVNLLQQLTCGGLPGTTSPIKLFDGAALIPRGRVEQQFIYQLEKDGTVDVKVRIKIFANNLGNAQRQSQLQNEQRTPVAIDHDAKLQIDTSLRFEPSGEWTIYNPHVVASGWNLPTGY